jgi:Protein of unknown function (DUF3605)
MLQLPTLKYGYATSPMRWEELHEAVVVRQDLDLLRRNEAQQQVYEQRKIEILREWNSMADYVLYSKFGRVLDKQRDGETGKYTTTFAASPTSKPYLVLGRNDFPYCLADDILHYVLWKLVVSPAGSNGDSNEQITDSEIEQAKKLISHQLTDASSEPSSIEFRDGEHLKQQVVCVLHWKNPPRLQSIPNVDHVHIVVRVKQASASMPER